MCSWFRAALGAAAFAFLSVSGSPLAHEGHDHDATAPASDLEFRAAAPKPCSELYELVAIARAGELAIYLDQFATNELVDDASIEVETPIGPESARAVANEPYRLSAPWTNKPGTYELIFTITKDGNADVLPATLIIPSDGSGGKAGTAATPASAGGNRGPPSRNVPMMLIAGLGGFVAGIVLVILMRRRSQPAMILVLAGMLAIFIGPARAHEGEDHDAPAHADFGRARPGATAARRRRVRA